MAQHEIKNGPCQVVVDNHDRGSPSGTGFQLFGGFVDLQEKEVCCTSASLADAADAKKRASHAYSYCFLPYGLLISSLFFGHQQSKGIFHRQQRQLRQPSSFAKDAHLAEHLLDPRPIWASVAGAAIRPDLPGPLSNWVGWAGCWREGRLCKCLMSISYLLLLTIYYSLIYLTHLTQKQKTPVN